MNSKKFNFSEKEFNKIFPFFLLLDKNLVIKEIGKSLVKLINKPIIEYNFLEVFEINRPVFEYLNSNNFKITCDQLISFVDKNDKTLALRGQINEHEDGFLFLGTPWFQEIEDLVSKKLTIKDFAFFDSTMDLLHILKNQEINNQELKDLLFKINNQKKILNKDKDELFKLSLVASANNGGVVFTKSDGTIYWCNEAYEKLTGFSKEEMLGKIPFEIGKNKETSSQDLIKMLNAFNKKESFDIEILHHKKNNETFWARSKGQPLYDDKNNFIGYFSMVYDISDEKIKDEKLQILSLIAQENTNAVVICDKFGKIEWVNNSFIKITGYSLQEVVSKTPGSFLQGKETNPETIEYLRNCIQNAEPFNCEILNYNKNKEKYWIRIQGQVIKDKNDSILKYFAIEEDITLQKLLEIQKQDLLLKLEKQNEQLNEYAQIVSHDLKSPLRSIHSLITWIKEDNIDEFSQETKQYLDLIEGKVEKMDHLIQGILTYSKVDSLEFENKNIDINLIINNIINIIDIPSNVTIKIVKNLPTILADEFRMQQLFQNIIVNATLYIDKPIGIIEVDCLENNNSYIFSIKDNGPGISKENQKKIFNVFQSFTKNEKSTGIGLSIVKRIIDNYKGEIWIESELNIGTTFFIKLFK